MSLLMSLLSGGPVATEKDHREPTRAERNGWLNERTTSVPATDEFHLNLLKDGPLNTPQIAILATRTQLAAIAKMYRLEKKGLVFRHPGFKPGTGKSITWELVK